MHIDDGLTSISPQKSDQKIFIELGNLASLVGCRDFYSEVLSFLGRLISWDQRMIVLYTAHSIPTPIFDEGVPQVQISLYLSGFYRVDPYLLYWREHKRSGVLTLSDVCKTNANVDDYITVFQPKTGMTDDICVLLAMPGMSAVGLFLGRKQPFTQRETEVACAVFPLILGLHKAHQRTLLTGFTHTAATKVGALDHRPYKIVDKDMSCVFVSKSWTQHEKAIPKTTTLIGRLHNEGPRFSVNVAGGILYVEKLSKDFTPAPEGSLLMLEVGKPALPPLSFEAALKEFLHDQLTPREREIVKFIISGYPSSLIAEKLSLSVGTIKNHRKRLYYKLNITTERELFLMFLNHITNS